MNKHTNLLKVISADQTTTLAREITFEIPENLKEQYRFSAGQYLTIHHKDEQGEKHIICYSICSPVDTQNISIGVKKVEDGRVSTFLLDKVQVGDTLEIGKPEGGFQLPDSSLGISGFCFLAGGSGITPIRSMIHTLLESGERRKVTLIYGNNDEDNVMFAKELEDLTTKYDNFNIVHCLGIESENIEAVVGKLDAKTTQVIIQKQQINVYKTLFFICGPSKMMEANLVALQGFNVPPNHIKTEYFTADNTQQLQTDAEQKIVPASVELLLNNNRIGFPMNEHDTLLEAAERHSIPINYSCRAGICSTCKCKLEEGEVFMANEAGLTVKEKKEGYILACQARPLTDKIQVNFDLNTIILERKKKRRLALVAGLLFAIMSIAMMSTPTNESLLAKGPMNKGHENLACNDCHTSAKGSVFQQVNANMKFLVGMRQSAVDFGLENVDNKKCQSCHERPNDRHPVHRFLEPRFVDARNAIAPQNCESCHQEHNGVRLSIVELDYCKNCHEDTEIKKDPIEIPHTTLIAEGRWETCLQCHDFHGNHVMETAFLMKDTISQAALRDYDLGGADPFGSEKKYLAKEEIEAIQKMKSAD